MPLQLPVQAMKPEVTPSDYGPAMRALTPIQQGFVIAILQQLEPNNTQALIDAGYTGVQPKRQALRYAHDPKIKAALHELAPLHASTIIGPVLNNLFAIATNPQHKDQAKVALALHDRYGGSTAAQTIDVRHEHTHTLTDPQRVVQIKALAARMGWDVAKIMGGKALPAPIEAEYVEVPAELSDLEDVL